VGNKLAPLLSIVVPVYNSAPYIKETIQSLLGQTFTDFELIICDDASADNSLEIINDFSDDRIHILRSASNKGQAYQLNTGIAAAKGKFVAIMHSDDICMPQRMEKQVSYLQQHASVGLVGCNVRLIGSWQQYYQESGGIWNYPADFREARWRILFSVPVPHSGVMFRRMEWAALKLMYDQDMVPAEDYDLWSRAIQYMNMENIQEVLMQYRVHDYQISVRAGDKEKELINKIRKQMMDLFLSGEDTAFRNAFYSLLYVPDLAGLSDQWFYRFYAWGNRQQFFPLKEFKEFISHRYCQYLQSLKKIPVTHLFKPVVFTILGWGTYKNLLLKGFIKRGLHLP
jgi:glycosyltransferase involved in cell wall biosynthesis